MFDQLKLKLSAQDSKQKEACYQKLKERYKNYRDPWGFSISSVKNAMDITLPIYRNYFQVRVFGMENVQDEPYMIVSNHTGQIPIDGMLITLAMAFESDRPRIIHSMVERFMAAMPFLGDMAAKTGSILGDRENCKWLLDKGESILVFPEGVRGINKPTKDFYKLQKFSSGFYRIAIHSKVKILPVTVIGAEEMFPVVFQAKDLGKKLGFPSLPLSLNLFPLPSPIDIYIGKPIEVNTELTPDAPENEIRKNIIEIENVIKANIAKGLKERRPFCDGLRKPINDLMKKVT
ncbi:MAG: glycerol acyltransferase [Halobacteriovoraceae bacterium]|nr:glycerol acyltransferase [Halobacteriovoraceae bacterium]